MATIGENNFEVSGAVSKTQNLKSFRRSNLVIVQLVKYLSRGENVKTYSVGGLGVRGVLQIQFALCLDNFVHA